MYIQAGGSEWKVEAWLKARRMLAMASHFQLLLSRSREWKMENLVGEIYAWIELI